MRRALEMARPCAVAMAVVTLAACAPAAAGSQAGTGAGTGPAGREAAGSTAAAGIDPACTRATKVKITGSDGTYAFSPSSITIQRGAALAVTNKSDAAHALATDPDAGMVTSVVDRRERQVIQFPDEGTFEVKSAGSRAVLRLTVKGDSGCGAPAHKLTIVAAQGGGYAFEPAKITVAATENFLVTNHSGVTQSVICDKDGSADDNRLDKDETQILALDEPGRYTCTSVQHSSAKATVTVDG